MASQPIEVKLSPGLLAALRGPKLWASLTTAEVISSGFTVVLGPMWTGAAVDDNGLHDAYLVNSQDFGSVDPALLIDATTGKFIFPLACAHTQLQSSNNGAPLELTDFWTIKFPSAAPEDLLTEVFTLIVKNGTEQAYSSVTVHRLPSTVVVDNVTERPPTPPTPPTP
jgi:hypothetical protein